jgi:O-antigen/teichoic acid export membrane protein
MTPSDKQNRQLARNTTALTIGRLGSKILVFLLVRFYTAVLTNEEFGTADLITSLCNFLIPLACAGLSGGFFRFAAEAKSHREQVGVFSSGASILAIASMGFALLSPILFLVPYFSRHVWLILLYVLCANIHYFVSDFIRAQGNYRLFAIQGILNTALNIGLNLVFLLPLSMGVTGYVLSIIIADIATALFLFIKCRLWCYLQPGAADRTLIKAILRYSIPLIPATLCWWITNVSDRFMVTYFCGEAQNGLYAAAYKIPNILTIAGGIFIDAWQFSAVIANRGATNLETNEQADERRRSLSAFFSRIFKGYGAFL